MASTTGRFGDRLHFAVATLSLWLIGTSPWISMYRGFPGGASWLDWSHVILGILTLVLGGAYAWVASRGGRWQQILPVLPSQLHAVRSDLVDLLRGRIPASESGGLFGLVEGLLLIALMLTGATGAAWWFAQGTDAALQWRVLHQVTACGLIGLLVAHVVAVGLHLLEFVRD
jgi:cytochrome b561